MPSNHLILCHPHLLLPSIFPCIWVFSNESALHIRWPKYWSFSFKISPTDEHPGPMSFRIDWLDLLAVQGTLKCLLQHHSSKASVLRCSAFFKVQLSHPYLTTGKTIALTRHTFIIVSNYHRVRVSKGSYQRQEGHLIGELTQARVVGAMEDLLDAMTFKSGVLSISLNYIR